jgi:hypothetical protein
MKRYGIFAHVKKQGFDTDPKEHPLGDWVKYSDVESSQRATKGLLTDIARLALNCDDDVEEDAIRCLQAIQDRLRQSGRLIGSRYNVVDYEVYSD